MDEITPNVETGKNNTKVVLLVVVLLIVVVAAFVFYGSRRINESTMNIPQTEPAPSEVSTTERENADDSAEPPTNQTGTVPIQGTEELSASDAQTTLLDIQADVASGEISETEAEQRKAEVYEKLPPPPLPPMP